MVHSSKGGVKWQHTEKSPQHVSATWQSPIGLPQPCGPHHYTDLTCGSHQHATWQAMTGPPHHPHVTWQHSVRPFFAPLTALKKELGDELRKKDTEIPLSVHWVYLYEFGMHI
jgi:hypothetical protein